MVPMPTEVPVSWIMGPTLPAQTNAVTVKDALATSRPALPSNQFHGLILSASIPRPPFLGANSHVRATAHNPSRSAVGLLTHARIYEMPLHRECHGNDRPVEREKYRKSTDLTKLHCDRRGMTVSR